jgi:phospholipid-translocating ATPase
MSVILRRPAPWNDIVLYCKGADNVISERLDKDGQDSDIVEKTFHDVNAFSENGLRTLLLSYRVLNKEEYENWKKEIDEASTASEKRAEKIADAQEKIEVNLKLLGATGIEDKLQEGVPQCIEDLRKAGIKIWVLTGDKLETAINIGYASNLLDGDMRLWTVRGGEDSEKVLQCLVDISNQLDKIEADQDNDSLLQENALIIEGSALIYIFETAESKEKLLDIAIRCKSVVCCRVSPLQKALVVQLVRKYHNVVTLAVGDGANDVSMIQVANVGVGIAGQEGVQAAMAADYAIAQFRFLHKLLLVQGHWSYSRISEMILTFFYKNVFWVFPSLWFQIYSGWSGNIFYDYSFLQLYNVVFTVAPVVILGK